MPTRATEDAMKENSGRKKKRKLLSEGVPREIVKIKKRGTLCRWSESRI